MDDVGLCAETASESRPSGLSTIRHEGVETHGDMLRWMLTQLAEEALGGARRSGEMRRLWKRTRLCTTWCAGTQAKIM